MARPLRGADNGSEAIYCPASHDKPDRLRLTSSSRIKSSYHGLILLEMASDPFYGSDRGAHLLDLDKGSMHPFGQLPFIGVTWSPDGRRAFYLGGESPRYEALIIMPDENRTADISSEFNSDFGNDFFSETDFYRAGETVPTSRWTVNGEWLVLNVHRRGASLLRPEPWRVFPVGPNVQAWLEKQSPATFGLPAHFSLTGEGYDPQVEPLPLPGVLLCYLPKIGRNCVIGCR